MILTSSCKKVNENVEFGHYLEHTKVPVISVDRTYRDKARGEEIAEKEKFIEGLTHDSIVIQIPALKEHRKEILSSIEEAEKLLLV